MAIELLKSKLVLPPLLPGLVARPHLLHLLDQGLLTKLTLQGRTDLAQYIQDFTGSNRYILDYLMEEVLERQPTTIQDFLLKTSILKRISAPLCEALYQEGQKSVPIETERLPSDRLDFPDILGIATITYSPTCCANACTRRRPNRSRRSTAGPAGGWKIMAWLRSSPSRLSSRGNRVGREPDRTVH